MANVKIMKIDSPKKKTKITPNTLNNFCRMLFKFYCTSFSFFADQIYIGRFIYIFISNTINF
ncbi:hypothetical protein BTS2_2430 [Bacillus sp. TS-2]|nr:hypothetical protein BTS2_2430 [Bacillus sp. TS-2]